MGSFARAVALAAALSAAGIGEAGGGGGVEVEWLSAEGTIPAGGALAVYRPTTDDEPADATPARFRAVVRSRARRGPSIRASIASVDPATSRVRDAIGDVPLARAADGSYETPWLVAVADREDRGAPWLSGRALVVRLGDVVVLRVRRGAERSSASARTVGSRKAGAGPLEILTVPLRAFVLRAAPGGQPVVGGDDRGARAVAADQLRVADAVLAQCHVEIDPSAYSSVAVEDPPGSSLLHVGGPYGLVAAGGEARLAADGTRLGPLRIGRGNTPEETARLLARALEDAGFCALVSINPRAARQAMPTADVVVRRRDGTLASVAPWAGAGAPLTTDPQQPLALGAVDLADGLSSYGAEELGVGTLEERTLIRSFRDPESGAVSLFVVDRFSGATKQGESFLPGGSVGPAIILDRRGVERARQAYALAHEIAHLLLGDLRHPDDDGDARTWLLMHSRSASARFGPKRLTAEQCSVIRSGVAGLSRGAARPSS
ncbi:MAG: hypothetical protein M0R80_19745 [Proteobacteria bacterium]|nr:hypothetical protein [Pseudomonadota bacterium]